MTRFHQNRNYMFVSKNSLRQQKVVNVVYVYNLPMPGPLTLTLYTFVIGPEHSCAVKKRKEKNVEYRDGIKVRRQDRDDYVHVMQLDNGNSQASLARAHYKPHNQPYIVAIGECAPW